MVNCRYYLSYKLYTIRILIPLTLLPANIIDINVGEINLSSTRMNLLHLHIHQGSRTHRHYHNKPLNILHQIFNDNT